MELTLVYSISVAAIVGAFGHFRIGTAIAGVIQKLEAVFMLKRLCYPVL
jgi:hypothetical protein